MGKETLTPSRPDASRVVCAGSVGFGFSSRAREPIYTLPSYARSVHEWMQALGLERASIVGHSLGGAVAHQFAPCLPVPGTERLVLLAPAIYLLRHFWPVRFVVFCVMWRVSVSPRARWRAF